MNLNKIIGTYGQQKRLDVALYTYAAILNAEIWPTVYTFTNIINACVRCGEIERAKKYMLELEKSGIKANEVTYTVIIKGFCSQGVM